MIEKFKHFKQMLNIIPMDKLAHSFYGSIAYIVISFFNSYLALTVVFIIALGTEIADKKGSGNSEVKDFIATIAIPILMFIQDYYKGL